MVHNATSTVSSQGHGPVANNSRNELPKELVMYFSPVDYPDILKALKRVHYLGLYCSEAELNQDDRFDFLMVDSLIDILEKEVNHD